MATPLRPASASGGPPTGRTEETTFTRGLRFEWASEEGRALVGSYAISGTLGIAFLLLVHLMPVRHEATSDEPVVVTMADTMFTEPPAPEPPPVAQIGEATRTPAPGPTNRKPGPVGPQRGNPKPGRPGSLTETNSTGAIGDAFGTGSGSGTGGMVGDVSGILRGVDVNSGSGGTGGGRGGSGGGGAGGKTVLGYGQGGQGSVTPGRGGIGGGLGTGGGGGGGVGGVGAGGGVTAARVVVRAPSVRASDAPAGRGRDVSELGTFVRSREAQLRYCYTERGLKANPSLAGTINVAITITGSGNVTGVDITSRTWGGAGASETESCIISKIRSWRFPSSDLGGGTYGFPFNFTK
ncbi:MAG TPA: AgmX/PglI C-terminal domain-containing protein [Gemmatimonadaceae bacterium]|nr:AgmX/PglI C-terminal domain-containing protein [Gemmatimonadaceae bacterium]